MSLADKQSLSIVVCASEINAVLKPSSGAARQVVSTQNSVFIPAMTSCLMPLIKFTQQYRIPKTAGIALGENNVLLLHVQFRYQLC